MKDRKRRRSAYLLIAVGSLLGIGLLVGGDEGMKGVGAGNWIEVKGVSLAERGNPVAVMGQLTIDSEPIPGSFFFLAYDPLGSQSQGECGPQLEYLFPEGTMANGAQICFIQHPNAVIPFTIAPSQFLQQMSYVLPFLPEDPPGAAALEFF